MVTVLKSLLTMSLSGSIIILLVLALRLVLKKAPARLVCLLWLLAGIRLMLPFHIEADFSLQPDTQQLIKPIVSTQEYALQENVSQEYMPQDMVPAMPTVGENITINTNIGVTTQVQRTVDWVAVAAYVWFFGAAVMLIYTAVSYIKLKRQVREAVAAADGAWECGSLNGPFLLGYLKPRIFLPVGLAGEDREYVLSHERTHLAWGDHWTKLLGFLCLSLHWFNPLVWLAYRLLCQDLEMACDEQVVKGYNVEQRKAYSKALLSCAAGNRPVSACPIAFGEVNVKERIMKVLHYRKPGFWICLVCVIAIIGAAVFFLTDPLKEMTMEDYAAMIGTERSELLTKLGLEEGEVTYSEASRLYLLPDTVQYNGREYQVYCDAGDAVRNRAISFKFVSKRDPDEQTSIEAFAQEFLALQAQYTEQYGVSRLTNGYTDVQQIVDAYENGRKPSDGWTINTAWEVYEDIPFAGVRDFLKEFVTWDEVTTLGKWYGRDAQGVLRVHLQGNYADGIVVFQVSYSARTMPSNTAKTKYEDFFGKYASALGAPRDVFLEELGIGEDEVRQSTDGDIWLEPVEHNGINWYITSTYREVLDNRVTVLEFSAEPAESFEEMAQNYLSMEELLTEIYGTPGKNYGEFETPEDILESYEHWPHKGGAWSLISVWQLENVENISPQLQERMDDLTGMDYVIDSIKTLYGDDATPKPSLNIRLFITNSKGIYHTSVAFVIATHTETYS